MRGLGLGQLLRLYSLLVARRVVQLARLRERGIRDKALDGDIGWPVWQQHRREMGPPEIATQCESLSVLALPFGDMITSNQ